MHWLKMRAYSALWWTLLPLALFRLWRRGKFEPGYRRHIGERLGFYRPAPAEPLLWVHAVSVGETRAAQPLVEALLEAYPDHAILLTHMTPTGRATGKDLFGDEPRVVQSYLPYDTACMTRRFVAHYKPRVCVLLETEIWPGMVDCCRRRRVPVALVNARLSERSLKSALRFEGLMGAAARGIALAAAQTEADAGRLRRLGAPHVEVTGSMKFDIEAPATMLARGSALRLQVGARPVLLCASTREGEEALLLEAYKRHGDALPKGALLLVVPRHPQRFDEVAQLVQAQGLSLARRSRLGDDLLAPDVQVLLGDSMGEMFAYYAACDLAFVGGSLLPLGGQNLIEACAVGKPVLIGPHTFNFAQSSEDAVALGAAIRVDDAGDALRQAARVLASPPELERRSAQALAFARSFQGATQKTVGLLAGLLG